jgi:hypothetical protein
VSGYGGQPPAGWQDPYGRQDPYGQNPYGQYGQQDPYGQQGQYGAQQQPGMQDGYGYGPPGVPPVASASNGAAIAAIICNCVGLVLTCGVGVTWLPGLILSGMAVGRVESDPAAARTLTIGAWICCALNFVIGALLILLIVTSYRN